jgi:hypothetical protein
MKQQFFLLLLIIPSVLFAQKDTRKSWYGSVGLGYGMYSVHIYNYNQGSGVYGDFKLSNPLIWLGMEKKSAWEKNDFVFDIGGELTGGFGVKNKVDATGGSATLSGGYTVGIHGLFKAGYLAGTEKGKIVPMLGVGPYYVIAVSHPGGIYSGGDFNSGNQVYGLQGYAGVDIQASDKFVITPQLHFGLVSWGWSDFWMGPNSDNNVSNGQPSMFEAGIKLAMKF